MAAVRRLNQQLHPESSQYSEDTQSYGGFGEAADDSFNALKVASEIRQYESSFNSAGEEDCQFRLASLNSSG